MRKIAWTPEMDAEIRRLAALRLSSAQTAKQMGLTREQVKKRGVRFCRYSLKAGIGEHRAFTPRCAELLRQAGVRI